MMAMAIALFLIFVLSIVAISLSLIWTGHPVLGGIIGLLITVCKLNYHSDNGDAEETS